MANIVFNIAKGRIVEYYNRVKSNDPTNAALILVPIETSGLESDATLIDADTLAATADAKPLADFAQAMGLVYMKVPQGDSYTMDHSATLVLLNPKAEFAGIIRPPLKPVTLAELATLNIDEQ